VECKKKYTSTFLFLPLIASPPAAAASAKAADQVRQQQCKIITFKKKGWAAKMRYFHFLIYDTLDAPYTT
jgi:hypothetical protein